MARCCNIVFVSVVVLMGVLMIVVYVYSYIILLLSVCAQSAWVVLYLCFTYKMEVLIFDLDIFWLILKLWLTIHWHWCLDSKCIETTLTVYSHCKNAINRKRMVMKSKRLWISHKPVAHFMMQF